MIRSYEQRFISWNTPHPLHRKSSTTFTVIQEPNKTNYIAYIYIFKINNNYNIIETGEHGTRTSTGTATTSTFLILVRSSSMRGKKEIL